MRIIISGIASAATGIDTDYLAIDFLSQRAQVYP